MLRIPAQQPGYVTASAMFGALRPDKICCGHTNTCRRWLYCCLL